MLDRIAWLVLLCGLAARPAWADGLSRATDHGCDESIGESGSPVLGPPEMEIPAEVPVRLTPEPAPPVPAPPASQPSSAVLWPMEYVLRPHTLPEGMTEVGVTARVFRPRSGRLTTTDGTPYAFDSNLGLGLWANLGVTDRLTAGFDMPQALCWSRSESS